MAKDYKPGEEFYLPVSRVFDTGGSLRAEYWWDYMVVTVIGKGATDVKVKNPASNHKMEINIERKRYSQNWLGNWVKKETTNAKYLIEAAGVKNIAVTSNDSKKKIVSKFTISAVEYIPPPPNFSDDIVINYGTDGLNEGTEDVETGGASPIVTDDGAVTITGAPSSSSGVENTGSATSGGVSKPTFGQRIGGYFGSWDESGKFHIKWTAPGTIVVAIALPITIAIVIWRIMVKSKRRYKS